MKARNTFEIIAFGDSAEDIFFSKFRIIPGIGAEMSRRVVRDKHEGRRPVKSERTQRENEIVDKLNS